MDDPPSRFPVMVNNRPESALYLYEPLSREVQGAHRTLTRTPNVYSNLGGGTDFYVGDRPDGVRQTWITDPDG